MPSERLYFIDTETTGLLPRVHEIISFGLIIAEDGQIIEEKEIFLKPEQLEKADPVALRINGYQSEKWSGALSQRDALSQIAELLTKVDEKEQKVNTVTVVGHNVSFDLAFLYGSFWREQIDFLLPRHVIDTYALAKCNLGRRSNSLSALCSHFNIRNERAHSALSDARACFEVYKRLCPVK